MQMVIEKKKCLFGICILLSAIAMVFVFASGAGAATGSFDRDNYLPSFNDSNDYDRAWISVTDTSIIRDTRDEITVTVKTGANSVPFVLVETTATSTVFTTTGDSQPVMYPVGATSGYVEDFSSGNHNFPALGTSVVGLNLKAFTAITGGDATSGTSGGINVSAGDTMELLYGGSTLDIATVGVNSGDISVDTSSLFPTTADSLASTNVILTIDDPD